MMKPVGFRWWLLGALIPGILAARTPLKQARFTQVVNHVDVTADGGSSQRPAKVSDLFRIPEVLRTGRDSLAELTAPDETVTRVGANTVFAFDRGTRSLRLDSGTLLLHSPKGRGGGTIRTRGASASILGTTIMLATTASGGFKMIVLEGKARVRLPNGVFRDMTAGQLVFALADGRRFSPIVTVDLGRLVEGSRLVNGFTTDLASRDRIEHERELQHERLEHGEFGETKLLVAGDASETEISVTEDSEGETLEQSVDRLRLQQLQASDATIASPVLDPDRLILESFNSGPRGELFRPGFVARNLTITTPRIDLTPYTTGDQGFEFVAFGQVTIANDLTLIGARPTDGGFETEIVGLSGLNLAPGIALTVDGVGNLALDAGTDLAINNVRIESLDRRRVEIETRPEGIASALGSLSLNAVNIIAGSHKLIGTDLTVTSSSIDLATAPGATTVDMEAEGDLSLANTTLRATPGSALSATATGTLNFDTVPGFSTANFSFISMQARTLTLRNIDFPAGSSVNLASETGHLAANPNTGQPIQPGFVNFVTGVLYGGAPAQTQVSINQGGTGPGNAINIGQIP